MSSTLLHISNHQPKEITQESVPQLSPGAWLSETGQKEESGFPCVHPDDTNDKFPWNRRRVWSGLN
jgi:hypothetical protein